MHNSSNASGESQVGHSLSVKIDEALGSHTIKGAVSRSMSSLVRMTVDDGFRAFTRQRIHYLRPLNVH